jgi:hypothetical protein
VESAAARPAIGPARLFLGLVELRLFAPFLIVAAHAEIPNTVDVMARDLGVAAEVVDKITERKARRGLEAERRRHPTGPTPQWRKLHDRASTGTATRGSA